MKLTAWLGPFVLFGAVIFVALVWIGSGLDDFLTLTEQGASTHASKTSDPPRGCYQPKPLSAEQCDGRYVFIYDLPPEFNSDLSVDCMKRPPTCDDFSNGGFGDRMDLPQSDAMASVLQPPSAWFHTDQFSLEVLIHRRLKLSYPCLTQNATQASLFYIPFYHGLDVARYIDNPDFTVRDHLSTKLLTWLRDQESWRVHKGNRHVLVLGRLVWDFWRRSSGLGASTWGSAILTYPELVNVTKLFIERSPWSIENQNQIAIPYPTGFHPASDQQLRAWKDTVRRSHRTELVSFAGSARSNISKSIVRGELLDQCGRSPLCKLDLCTEALCRQNSQTIYKLALESVFCLEPAGDSPTRKGIFDTLVAGCIPVVFNRDQTVLQYLWHLPGNGSSYSVMLDDEAVVNHYDVMQHLRRIPLAEVMRLQQNIVQLLPRLLYRNPLLDGQYTAKDAFDVAIDSLLDRLEDSTADGQDGA